MDQTQGKMASLALSHSRSASAQPPGNQRVENLADDSKLSVNTGGHSTPAGSGPASPKLGASPSHRLRSGASGGLNLLDEVVRVYCFAMCVISQFIITA